MRCTSRGNSLSASLLPPTQNSGFTVGALCEYSYQCVKRVIRGSPLLLADEGVVFVRSTARGAVRLHLGGAMIGWRRVSGAGRRFTGCTESAAVRRPTAEG
jgi:hypothetical protein